MGMFVWCQEKTFRLCKTWTPQMDLKELLKGYLFELRVKKHNADKGENIINQSKVCKSQY